MSIEYSDDYGNDADNSDEDKDNEEYFFEHIGDPVFDVYDEHDAMYDYPILNEDILMPMKQKDFNKSICWHEDFGKSNGATEFILHDTSFRLSSTSKNKNKDHIDDIQCGPPQPVLVFDKKDDTYMGSEKHINYVVWKEETHRHISYKPPDSDLWVNPPPRCKEYLPEDIFSDLILNINMEPSYEEGNMGFIKVTENEQSLIVLCWRATNKPPDPGRNESFSILGEKNIYKFFRDLTFNTGERMIDIFYVGLSVWSYYHSAYEGHSFNKFITLPLEDIINHLKKMCLQSTRASDLVSSKDFENHTKKIKQNVLYLTTCGHEFDNFTFSFCEVSVHELLNMRKSHVYNKARKQS